MRIGQLRQRVDSQRPVSVQDGSGDPVVVWESIATKVPARIEPLRGSELIAKIVLASKVDTQVTIRYRAGVDATMRLKHLLGNGAFELFNIAAVLPDPKSGREYLVMPVVRGLNDG